MGIKPNRLRPPSKRNWEKTARYSCPRRNNEGQVTQSAVLCAMRVPPELGRGAVRLTVGRFTTEDEIDRAAEALLRGAALRG